MPRFAKHECADCGMVLPSNELYRVSDSVLSSYSTSTRLYRGTRGGIGGGGSSRQTYKVRQSEVCPDCYEYRKVLARRAALKRFIGQVIVLCIGVAIVIIIANTPQREATSNATDWPTPTSSSELVVPVNVPSNSETPKAIIPQDTPTESVTGEGDSLPIPAEPPSEGEALLDATTEALQKGGAVKWRADGERGYVTVSEPQDVGDFVCRNVSFTVAAHDGNPDSHSPIQRWCRANNGGDWRNQVGQ